MTKSGVKKAHAAAAAMDRAKKNLEANLHLLEENIKKLDIYVDVGNREDAEIELQLIKEQHKVIIKLIDHYVELLRQNSMDYEAEIQLQRKIDIIRGVTFAEKACQRIFNTTATTSSSAPDQHRLMSLPKRELPKFDGDVRNWLSFWAAFQEIHNDKNIGESEKFHYLLQSTVADSAAYKVVNSYPASGANYKAAISTLQDRFGRKKTLIKVYVRDLLKLVVENSRVDKNMDFVDLVTQLDSQVRNLSQLGVTKDKYGELLYPVIESCIPEQVLDNYLRTPTYTEELEDLMNYLQNEVRRRMETDLAKRFGGETGKKNQATDKASSNQSSSKLKSSNGKKSPSTTTGFMNASGQPDKKKYECLFCQRTNHIPIECRTAVSWSLPQRMEAVKSSGACYKCLRTGHNAQKCKKYVQCISCGKNHNTLLCNEGRNQNPPPAVETRAPTPSCEVPKMDNSGDSPTVGTSKTAMANIIQKREVLLQTLTILVHGPRGPRRARAAYDSLSQSSYVKETIAKEVSLKRVGDESVVHHTFGGQHSKPQNHPIYHISASGLEENELFDFEVTGVQKISDFIDRLPRGRYIEECMLKGVHLTDFNPVSDEIEVLIGADMFEKLRLGGESIELDTGPIAVHTRLGWVLSGNLHTTHKMKSSLAMMTVRSSMQCNDQDLANLWSLEAIGINDPAETKSRKEIEESALKHFRQTVNQNDTGRYQVHLPWIEGHAPLPTNKNIAHKRLLTTTRSLKENGHLEGYDNVFNSWLDEGIIEIVKEDSTPADVHYLPHRAIYKEGSTTPLRPVFDASAKVKNNVSLNDCLEKGPNLLELVPAMITRLRLDKFAVSADIEKAFLQLLITPRDRDNMRFHWWADITECKNLITFRHTRAVFGVSSSPFLLAATIRHHLENYRGYPKTCEALLNAFYVDNVAYSLPTMAAAQRFQSESTEIMKAGQFNLRGWELGPRNEDKDVPILGLLWNLREDTLRFDIKKLLENVDASPTKRSLYMLINMLFDPLGFAAPYTAQAKILLKKVCSKEKTGWDHPLAEEHTKEFRRWQQQIPQLEELRIPRYVGAKLSYAKITLHIFCDASQLIFATSAYLRVDYNNEVNVSLIQCKTRVSPKKQVSIPRLELLSCLIGARLSRSILSDMKMDIPVRYWTDSSTALTWIRRDAVWATFVNNRVREIRTLTKANEWAHVPGHLNPADLPSRGSTVKKILDQQWWRGPSWLYQPEVEWNFITPEAELEEVLKEMKKTVVSTSSANVVNFLGLNKRVNTDENVFEKLIKFSDYPKTLRVMAYILRFVNKARKKTEDFTLENVPTVEEVQEAEKYLLRHVQESLEVKEMKNFPCIKDEFGLLRLKSRLIYGEDNDDFKYPIVLPSKHPLVHLMIKNEHELASHTGTQYLLARLRERYWIVKGRKTIRNVILKCSRCRRYNATRCYVKEGALPVERIKTTKCFQVTGVDVAGPLFVEKRRKVWIALFTCGVYRAIHMEILTSLSTEAFLGALRKFIARRGRPRTVFSDNGTNFTGCNKLLEAVKWDKVLEYANVQQIRWRFNPPSAAWWGGWWERLIGMVKQILKRVLGTRFVKQAQLEILITEVESAMNDRPLTYVSENPEDLRPLTPAMFLRDLPVAVLPEVDVSEGKGLRINLKKIQKMRDELKKRFRKEYLGQLMNNKRAGKSIQINPGDVVLVEMENSKRVDWPMGIVMEVYPGKDNEVRVAKIKTAKGAMTRPVQRLFPLEVKTAVREAVQDINLQPCADDNTNDDNEDFAADLGLVHEIDFQPVAN